MGSGTGGAVQVVIGPKDGHGNDAVAELGGHYVMMRTTLTGAEGDDVLTGNDFRNISLVTRPNNIRNFYRCISFNLSSSICS